MPPLPPPQAAVAKDRIEITMILAILALFEWVIFSHRDGCLDTGCKYPDGGKRFIYEPIEPFGVEVRTNSQVRAYSGQVKLR